MVIPGPTRFAFSWMGRTLIFRSFLVALIFLFTSIGSANPNQEIDAKGIGVLDSVTATLEKQPAILLQQQNVETNRGALQQQSGAFDTSIGAALSDSHQNIPITQLQAQQSLGVPNATNQLTETTTTNLNLSKTFRTGVSFTPSIGVVRTD